MILFSHDPVFFGFRKNFRKAECTGPGVCSITANLALMRPSPSSNFSASIFVPARERHSWNAPLRFCHFLIASVTFSISWTFAALDVDVIYRQGPHSAFRTPPSALGSALGNSWGSICGVSVDTQPPCAYRK